MKAQYSMEYLLTIGMVLFVLLIFIVVYWQYQNQSTQEVDQSKIKIIADEILDNVKTLNSAGGYSVKKLSFAYPKIVKSVYVSGVNNNELVINYTGSSKMESAVFRSDVGMVNLIDINKSLGSIYIVKSAQGFMVLCTNASCKCHLQSCCSINPMQCGVGDCRNGTSVCNAGSMTACALETRPRPEVAEGSHDENCDGTTT
jgi:uncharacterized protein (UPF0333 family)